jgi:hypothetical protein
LGKVNYYVARLSVFLIMVTLIAGIAGCGPPSQNLEIWDWYDLNAIRDNLGGSYILMNDLDSTTDGYEELVSLTANGGAGWQPIGAFNATFTGTFDGQGYEIHDLFINRPYEGDVGLFGYVSEGGVIKNLGVVNTDVTGLASVGGLIGENAGNVSNSYSTGNVTDGGWGWVGGLIGGNAGTVNNSYSTSYVTGYAGVGGLVAFNDEAGTVSNSYSSANVMGEEIVGGLVAGNAGIVSNSYSTGSVTGNNNVGGLVGENHGTVSNSYSTGNVTGDVNVGGLVGTNEEEGTVSDSFWDTETSRQSTSDGGTGKTTAKMKNIATFSGAGWNMIAVGGPSERNPTHIWNIVNGVTYPFLSWQM